MKNLAFVGSVLLALSGTALAGDTFVGDTIVFSDGLGSGPGGEFLATGTSSAWRTFCVQTSEYLSFGPGFTVGAISTASQNDNVALSPKTAWLYQSFRNGTLPNITNTGFYSSVADADALQAAIWSFQLQTAPVVNFYTTLANTANPQTTGSVFILNMLNSAGGPSQDVLSIIPLPTGAGLALAGLGGLAIRRRRTA